MSSYPSQNDGITNVGVDVRKGDNYLLLLGVLTGAATTEISVQVPQNLKIDLLLVLYRDSYLSMFNGALFTTANKRKHLKCSSNNE